MTKTVNAFWDALQVYCDDLKKKGIPIVLHASLKDSYIKNCGNAYDNYKGRYMKSGVENLDRHKNAAILVLEGEALDLITADEKSSEEIFIGQEKILLITAFRYLIREFNNVVERAGDDKKKVTKFEFPDAFSCNTDYLDVLCRMLYREKKEVFSKNPDTLLTAEMSWAERLFLLEYISIHKLFKDKASNVFDLLKAAAQNG